MSKKKNKNIEIRLLYICCIVLYLCWASIVGKCFAYIQNPIVEIKYIKELNPLPLENKETSKKRKLKKFKTKTENTYKEKEKIKDEVKDGTIEDTDSTCQ